MSSRLLCVLIVTLLIAGCSRRQSQPTASGAGTVQAATATGPAASQTPPVNPGPVEQPAAAAQSTTPSQSSPVPVGSAAANSAQVPVSAQSTSSEPAPVTVGSDPRSSPSPNRASQVANVEPAMLTIPANTRIRVRVADTLDTRHSYPGQRFSAYLDEPIVSGDRVVVPKGTVFQGHVIEAKRSGRLKGRAYLGVTLDAFRLRGARYRVVTAPDFRSSRSHRKRNVVFIAGGTGTGATVGALAGGGLGAAVGAGAGAVVGTTSALVSGRKDVKLPVETRLVFSLRAPITVHS